MKTICDVNYFMIHGWPHFLEVLEKLGKKFNYSGTWKVFENRIWP